MKRFLAVAALCSLVLAGGAEAQGRRRAAGPQTPPPPAPQPQPQPQPPVNFGAPLAGLNAAQTARFNEGRTEFGSVEDVDDGLGPVFNGRSCGECHNQPALGGGSNRLVTRIGRTTNGVYDPLMNLGGQLLQNQAIGPRDGSPHAFRPEQVPQQANVVTRRRSTPLFGLGLVDATPDQTFINLAAAQAARNDGTAGRVALVDNAAAGTRTVGKFGWKAQIATLLQFSGDAYLNEMGITSPAFPNENCPGGNCAELQFNPRPGLNDGGEDVTLLADFMAILAAPPRGATNADTNAGEQLFNQIGCNSCHVASLQSGAHAIAALNRVTYQPYSDFLLHDMGNLGDGIPQGAASAREIRTAPLWGLRVVTQFLHDGRANTLDAAINAHDGQGRASRDRFNALNANDRNRLLAFLRSL
ncbi:MAG TPA: di-heme oxidoredictase family protein [Thermoanaerobaculia bacterium]|nr:di-heme oxidoredictase family protein [Thermoanaerobaculia bacterium]